MRTAVSIQADLLAISYADRIDLTYGSDDETEKVHLQYISGAMFSSFGLQPALGRLLTVRDDVEPGAHPYAVLSDDYWARRFGRDPKVVGRTFRMASRIYEIVGVAAPPFTGTEPGTVTDVFLPMMMRDKEDLECLGCAWLRVLVKLRPGASPQTVRESLQASAHAHNAERAKGLAGLIPPQGIRDCLNEQVVLDPAAAGLSDFQRDNGRPLLALGVLAGLVLLIACINVANLMTIQSAARAREMALRISIGAPHSRLVRLVLVESAWIALLAASVGAWFAWWSAPFVVSRVNPPDNPARLLLPADWRVFAFALTVAIFHHQHGAAPNVIELHPLLDIQFNPAPPPGDFVISIPAKRCRRSRNVGFIKVGLA